MAPELGETPVEEIDLAERPDHDVLGLHVPVHDAARVGVMEDVGDLLHDPHAPLDRERLERFVVSRAEELDDAPDRLLALHEAHDVVELPRLVGPHVVHGDDPRVLELGRDLGLAEEPLDELDVRRVGPELLQRDGAREVAVLCGDDDAHAPLAQELAHLVARCDRRGRTPRGLLERAHEARAAGQLRIEPAERPG